MVELTQHPAQARHPISNAPLFDDDGKPVALLPDHRAIRLDKLVIGYASRHGINFIVPKSKLPDWVYNTAVDLVEKEFGDVPNVSAVVEVETPTEGEE